MKKIIKYITIFIILTVLLTTTLVLSASINKKYMIKNIEESVKIFKNEKWNRNSFK